MKAPSPATGEGRGEGALLKPAMVTQAFYHFGFAFTLSDKAVYKGGRGGRVFPQFSNRAMVSASRFLSYHHASANNKAIPAKAKNGIMPI